MREATAPVDPALLEAVLRPFPGALTLPAETYTSPEVLAWERRHFFDGSWVCAGRASEPGTRAAGRVAEWHGWLFVNASGDAPEFADHIGNLGIAVDAYAPERLVVGATHEYEVGANWKIVVENYLECYHCSSIHPELCHVSPPESDYGYAERPSGTWVGGPMGLRDHAETMSLTGESKGVPIPGLPTELLREIGYAAVLPNVLISPHPDYLMTHRLEPLAPDRTYVECQWLFPPEAFERPGFTPDYAADFWDVTNREDWRACESVQRAVASRGYRQGPMSTWEVGVWEEMAMIARGYREGRLVPLTASERGPAPFPEAAPRVRAS